MNAPLLERYRDRIAGVLTCYDRMIITGTLPGACHAAGMTSFLNAKHIRIFDYPRFAEPLRDHIRANAEALAAASGVTIQYIAKAHIRKHIDQGSSEIRLAAAHALAGDKESDCAREDAIIQAADFLQAALTVE